MLQKILNNKLRLVQFLFLVLLLVLIRAFENQLFYDPFLDFFKKEKALKTIFDKMSYTHHKEYIVWLTSAKKEETLQNRLIKFKEMLQSKNK